MDFVLLIIGVAGLWLGTELTIGGALAIARRHGLSEFFVGLVLLSIGSDLPELAVAVGAGLKGLSGLDASGVVVGTSIGSVMGQIGFVLGVAGLLGYLTLPRRFILSHGSVLLGATVLLFLVGFDGQVSRIEGMLLCTVYLIYVFALLRNDGVSSVQPEALALNAGGLKSWAALIAGLAVIIASSELAVVSVLRIAQNLDVSQALISVLIIGIGTSLPELSISISAILKKRTQLSVGNIIGSNILDTLLPIGIAAAMSPLFFEAQFLFFDLPYIFVLTSVVLFFFIRKRGLQTGEAAVILAFYAAYAGFKIAQF